MVDEYTDKPQSIAPYHHIYPNVSSDGVGRTGTFICLHSQLERFKTEGVVDFFQAVKSARIQRAGLVPDVVCSSPLLSFSVSLLSHPLSRSHLASFSLSHILSQLGVYTYSHYPSLLLSPILPSISLLPFLSIHFPFMCSPRLTMSSVMKWWILMWTVLRLMPTSKKLSKALP